MEMKLKFAEFAELIGTTAKTVYKMEEREEIVTVTEKVNNRPTRLVVTNNEQINHFRNVYSKSPVNVGNCEDIVTNINTSMNVNNTSQSTNNGDVVQEMFDKIVAMNEQYNNRIAKLNEELIDSKSKLLFLEDKAGREGLYLQEINELKTENKELKTTLKQFRNTCEQSQEELFQIAREKSYYVPAAKAKQEDVDHVKSLFMKATL